MTREMPAGDARWAAGLMQRQRQAYAGYLPAFWRPARDAAGLHERFLRRQILSEATVALRTRHGFIICERRNPVGLVDDFTVTPPGTWDCDGGALLLAAAGRLAADGIGAVRVVTAHADRAKAGMLASLSLTLAEQWWVRELQPARQPAAPGRVKGPGFSGMLGPAPPIYDPCGLVFLADRAGERADIDAIARAAQALGAVLAVIPAIPGTAPSRTLSRKGWTIASDWYLGWPQEHHSRPRRCLD
ncbi:MAG: hypothetical protein JOY82_19030 [Streptosporangiaceae bacterium]|nr:hypothetical protein [Streptosporangiaceae bacterium]MBV9856579.1 hypothetical protein [Streptosporangiaceae bacterium]